MSVPSSPSASPSWSGGRRNSQQRNSGPKSAGEPPRPARDGYEWVWFPEGYWAERPLECRRSSNKSQASSTVGKRLLSWTPRSRPTPRDATHDAFGTPTTPGIGGISDSDHDVLLTPRGFTPVSPMSSQSQRMSYLMMNRGLPQSPYLSEQEQVAALQNPLAVPREIDSEDTWKSSSPPEEPAEEAAARTRRGTMAAIGPMNLWRSMHNHHHQHRVRFEEPADKDDKERIPMPDAAPSYFTQKPIRPPSATPPEQELSGFYPQNEDREQDVHYSPSKSHPMLTPWPEESPTTKPSAGPKGLRKWLKMIPRSRKDPQSNSNHDNRFAKDTRQDSASSSSVAGSSITRFNREVFIPGSTKSYPAGEAQHVEMPPLKQQTANGQPRSLLMDIKHPNIPLDQLSLEDAGSSSSGSIRATPRVFSYRKDQLTAKRQWWDQPKAPVRRDPVRDVSFFEFNMPEHLPNSPMCPANPLNKGKLKVCVYHGRRKQESVDESAAMDDGDGDGSADDSEEGKE